MNFRKWAFILPLLLAGSLFAATTYTTRTGIPKPADGDTGWGTVLRSAFDVIDSSMCVLSAAQTFTAANHFNGAVTMDNGNSITFLSASGGATGGNIRNSASLGHTLSMTFGALDGLFINGNYFSSNADVNIFPGTGHSYGSFAVIGSSADATTTYSGFISTSSVDSSTLWSLPKKDAVGLWQSDGSGHLSISSTFLPELSIGSSPTDTNAAFFVNSANETTGIHIVGAPVGGFDLAISTDKGTLLDAYQITNSSGNFQSIMKAGHSGLLEQTYSIDGSFIPYEIEASSGSSSTSVFVLLQSTGVIISTDTAVIGNLSISGYSQFASKTKSVLGALSPSVVGQTYYCSDCATAVLCISSGTAAGQFYSSTSRSVGCQ